MAFAVTDLTRALRGADIEPAPCPVCGEPLTDLHGGGSECEASGCIPCPVCYDSEATDGGRPCVDCLLDEVE